MKSRKHFFVRKKQQTKIVILDLLMSLMKSKSHILGFIHFTCYLQQKLIFLIYTPYYIQSIT